MDTMGVPEFDRRVRTAVPLERLLERVPGYQGYGSAVARGETDRVFRGHLRWMLRDVVRRVRSFPVDPLSPSGEDAEGGRGGLAARLERLQAVLGESTPELVGFGGDTLSDEAAHALYDRQVVSLIYAADAELLDRVDEIMRSADNGDFAGCARAVTTAEQRLPARETVVRAGNGGLT